MQFTRRDMTILGVFGCLLAAGVTFWVMRQTRVAESTPSTSRVASSAKPSTGEDTVLEAAAFADPHWIPATNTLTAGKTESAAAEKPASGATRATAPNMPVIAPVSPGISAPPIPRGPESPTDGATPPTTPAPGTESGSAPSSTPASANVAVTGVFSIRGVRRIVVENLDTKEVRFVRSGDSAFGYRIIGVNAAGDRVLVDHNGEQVFKALGEGKQSGGKADTSKTGSSGTTSSPGSSGTPSTPPSPGTPTSAPHGGPSSAAATPASSATTHASTATLANH